MSESKGQRIYKSIMLILITAIVTGIGTSIFVYEKISNTSTIISQNESGLELALSNIRGILEDNYIGEIDDEKMLESAIKGYVQGLGDEYAEYYTPIEMSNELDEAIGNYVGIGIYMTVNKTRGQITVFQPMIDSPAEKAGIKAEDIITKIDGVEVTVDNVEDMSNAIKGEEGTKVKLEIQRGEETLNFEVERKRIVISHINSRVLKNNVGYINIVDFDGGAAEEFETKYNELKKQNITSLIIDVRSNGGGVVDEAIDILEMLCEKGDTLLITVDKNNNEVVTKSKKKQTIDIPIVVLVNENTASATEIFAGALKDHDRAELVGQQTYGKGVIQTLIKLSDGSGLKMTTEEYCTPNKNKINKVGITPDYEIELPNDIEELTDENDTQLNKAIELLK